jgi:drug/metabolite transporter (DMT)-like permease
MTNDSKKKMATTAGFFAVLFWSINVAFSRRLTEQLGVLTAACFIYLGAGGLGSLYVLGRPKERRKLAQIPWRYWLGCGPFFVLNILFFHLAVGLASGEQKVVEVGLVNYLWISLALILSVPILQKKARLGLAPGIAIACGGIVVAALQWGPLSWEVFIENMRGSRLPYILAFCGAVSWALYSNFSGRWGADFDGWPVPLFLLTTGIIFLGIRLTVVETTVWSPRVCAELAATIVFPTLLAYICWDVAMRKGTAVLVVSACYLTPLLSTLINCAYLRVPPRPTLWLACAMVIGGAILCRRSVAD